MDEARMRAVAREEIALAMKTLEGEMYSSDPEDDVTAERALSSFNTYAYRGACEKADEERAENPFEDVGPWPGSVIGRPEANPALRAQEPKGPFADRPSQPHVHRFEYADDGAGNSGSFCECGAEELAIENERRRIAHAAAYLPAVDLNALDAGAYKLLGNLARNDPYTNAVIRLVQHGGPRIGR
ncbi:hypothetical protein ACW7N6_38110 [Streptomyces sp. UC1A3]